MKTLILSLLTLASVSIQAKTIGSYAHEDMIQAFNGNEEMLKTFMMENGFMVRKENHCQRYQCQQQQQIQIQQQQPQQSQQQEQRMQQQYQYPTYYIFATAEEQTCNILQKWIGAWQYQEVLEIGEILYSKTITSSRKVSGGMDVTKLKNLEEGLKEAKANGNMDVRLKCGMSLSKQEINQPDVGTIVIKKVINPDCLKSCEENGMNSCSNYCEELSTGPVGICEAPTPKLHSITVSCSFEVL